MEEESIFSLADSVNNLLPESNDDMELNSEAETRNPSHKRPKRLWQNSYLTTFPWLRYDAAIQTAYCSFKNCSMYDIFAPFF